MITKNNTKKKKKKKKKKTPTTPKKKKKKKKKKPKKTLLKMLEITPFTFAAGCFASIFAMFFFQGIIGPILPSYQIEMSTNKALRKNNAAMAYVTHKKKKKKKKKKLGLPWV
jgi:Na+/melibiose symporter-like transporter